MHSISLVSVGREDNSESCVHVLRLLVMILIKQTLAIVISIKVDTADYPESW